MFKKRRPTGVLSHSKSDSSAQSEPDAPDDSESLSCAPPVPSRPRGTA